eukprot:15470436-Alexandrium_andersonii.AAC.1
MVTSESSPRGPSHAALLAASLAHPPLREDPSTRAKRRKKAEAVLPPIQFAINEWHDNLSHGTFRKLAQNLRATTNSVQEITIGTACSGTDIIIKVAESIAKAWRETYDICFHIVHAFACEKDPEKQDNLTRQFPELSIIFNDINDLSETKATNVISGTLTPVPWVFMFACGFVCKSRTRLSSKASQNRNCIQNSTDAETAFTFNAARDYIQSARPNTVILENVIELDEGSEEGGDSDAAYVLGVLKDLGYVATVHRFNCKDYGSPVERNR